MLPQYCQSYCAGLNFVLVLGDWVGLAAGRLVALTPRELDWGSVQQLLGHGNILVDLLVDQIQKLYVPARRSGDTTSFWNNEKGYILADSI